ncbi:hypothetical protein D9756_008015 [Leucocoprinus leucothites]|uniref:NAD(P)-binding domain-containing protein n=1 Tax=Leucocoprinus leucothites TaxID=201217 RepID=A0A8H5FY44_9AGAR|nr:hypothetical protein D9756_008015 [Leucoagaricus leucothites]
MSGSNGLNVLVLGGSRHIGYHAAIRLLDSGARVTFLLRNPSSFDEDAVIQKYITSKKALLVKGDATVRSDMQRLWNVSTEEGSLSVDVVLCTIGFSGSPTFSLFKGLQITPPNLLTVSLLNLFSTMPSSSSPSPKIVVITATGVTPKSRSSAPLLLRPIYSYLIQGPLQDKLGAERIVHVLGGWKWEDGAPEPEGSRTLDEKWLEMEGMPRAGSVKGMVIVRPAMLNDGECLADKGQGEGAPYRVGEGEVGGWSVSRRDVAHFVFELVSDGEKWERYKDRQVSIAY